MVNKTTAVALPTLSDDDYLKLLRASGMVQDVTPSVNRIKVEGLIFNVGDDQYVANPKTGQPAFRARLLGPLVDYQALWITDGLADQMGRSGFRGFCKSFDFKFAEDGSSCANCPAGPWVKYDERPLDEDGKRARCSLKGDLELQILDANGTITDETVYTLTLSTSAVVEFRGTKKDQTAGAVSKLNFLQKLMRLGAQLDAENPSAGVAKALAAYQNGGVVVDVHSLKASSDDGARTWYVPSLTPVEILDIEQPTMLPQGASEVPADGDELPF